MKVIGLCGGSGSGKGTVANMFSEYGVPNVDTDDVYHKLINAPSPCLEALAAEFGDDILDDDGSLNRKKLSDIVFCGNDADQKRAALNRISHRFVLERTREILAEYEKQGMPFAIVDAPLLFESGFNSECDFIVSVIASKEKRVERIVKRDNITEDAAIRRIESQKSDKFLVANSDFVIDNSASMEETKNTVKEIANKILKGNI